MSVKELREALEAQDKITNFLRTYAPGQTPEFWASVAATVIRGRKFSKKSERENQIMLLAAGPL